MDVAFIIALFALTFVIYFLLHGAMIVILFGRQSIPSLVNLDLAVFGSLILLFGSIAVRRLTFVEEYLVSIGYQLSTILLPQQLFDVAQTKTNILIILIAFCAIFGFFIAHTLAQILFGGWIIEKGNFILRTLGLMLASVVAYIGAFISFAYMYPWLNQFIKV